MKYTQQLESNGMEGTTTNIDLRDVIRKKTQEESFSQRSPEKFQSDMISGSCICTDRWGKRRHCRCILWAGLLATGTVRGRWRELERAWKLKTHNTEEIQYIKQVFVDQYQLSYLHLDSPADVVKANRGPSFIHIVVCFARLESIRTAAWFTVGNSTSCTGSTELNQLSFFQSCHSYHPSWFSRSSVDARTLKKLKHNQRWLCSPKPEEFQVLCRGNLLFDWLK